MKRKKTLLASLVVIIGSAIICMNTGFSFINASFELYGNLKDGYNQKRAEDNLDVLYTGLSIKYVEKVFGPPMIENHDNQKNVHEYVYSFKKFYLQFVYNNDNKVILYAVTIKDKNFHPNIPYLSKPLGETFFSYDDNVSFLYSSRSSKFYEYGEVLYLGNPGNYRNFYLTYNPAGVEYAEINPLPDFFNDPQSPPLEKDWVEFRKENRPNTFAVGEYMGDPNGGETFYGIGVDFFDARDVPTLDY